LISIAWSSVFLSFIDFLSLHYYSTPNHWHRPLRHTVFFIIRGNVYLILTK
jgi:hypothetical protein